MPSPIQLKASKALSDLELRASWENLGMSEETAYRALNVKNEALDARSGLPTASERKRIKRKEADGRQ